MWNRTDTEIKITLIRHGQTPGNLEHRYIGKTDEALCAEGKTKLLQKDYWKLIDADVIFSSPMKRCIQTANIIVPSKKLVIINEWQEMDFGDFEGKNYQELQGNDAYQKWIDSNGSLPFPNGESRSDFIRRSMHGLQKACNNLLKTPNNERDALAIVHGGTIMAIMHTLTDKEYFYFQVKCGEGYECILVCGDEKIKCKDYKRV